MMRISFDFFLEELKKGHVMDETCFYFIDEMDEPEHYIGCLPEYEKPYWAGLCDIPNGTEFLTAEELVDAPIYDGRSIKERWQDIRFILLGGLSVEDYLSFRDIKEYFCTSCGAILNDQPGFNPEVGIWTCTECGMLLMDAETYETKIVSGVAWYCDNCGELLNNQAGFSDVSGWWRCTTCGCINGITDADIINSDPDTLWPVT